AGMGKTRLIEQFVTWAATQGADVLVGRAYESGIGLPYQPLIQLLRQRIERENAPEDLLSDLWLSQLTRLLPELRERYPDLPPPTQEENSGRQHLFKAIARLGQALAAHRPVVLFIDDWHWADSGSLDVLQYVAQRWVEENVPILLLLTLRQDALNDLPDLQNWLVQFKRIESVQQLALNALSPEETTGLIELLFSLKAATAEGQSTLTEFSDWLFDETAGQPLFLTEALKILARDGVIRPEQTKWQLDWPRFDRSNASSNFLKGVLDIIQGWLIRISTPAAELLRATAVLVQDATFDNLAVVAGLDEGQALSALDELLKYQLLLEAEEAQAWPSNPIYSYSHHKVSEAVYAEAGKARRRMLHRRAFEALQTQAVPSSTLAGHALNAGLLPEGVRYSLISGNEAMDLFAVRVAIIHYETVWEVAEPNRWPEDVSGADRQALYTGLGRAYELSESWAKAEKIYRAMITYARSIPAPAMECLGLNLLATVQTNGMGDREQALAILEQARSVAKENGDKLGLAETELSLSRALAFGNDSVGGLGHVKKALGMARNLEHPDLLARSLSVHAMIDIQLRRWPLAAAHANEASR
ncbi:MAG: AAA family ATPase, partial [Chloroflexota bacterium]